jgi:hypothetical protein
VNRGLSNRLDRLELRSGAERGRWITLPGFSEEDAKTWAAAMRKRGEIADDDFIDARPDLPFAPPEIERLNCTNQEFAAWLDTLPSAAEFAAMRNAGQLR